MELLRESSEIHKQMKEEFVSNLSGSSMAEIAALSAIVPSLILLRQWTSSSGIIHKNSDIATETGGKDRKGSYILTLSIDVLCIVLPILLILTILADWIYECAIFLISSVILFFLSKRNSIRIDSKEDTSQISSFSRNSILSYRVSMMIVTSLSILAVDFRIFPRRLAKVETYGTSLMDLGVGSFVLANSLVSKEARNAVSMSLKGAFKSTGPLILLGLGRLAFTAGVDYQVHVGEYGVHWNFFFTLAAVSILTSIIRIHTQFSGILGSSILVAYQTCLLKGLNVYLLSNDRTLNIINQNKEGIFSIFGYWGLYLMGVQLGNHIFFGNHSCKIESAYWIKVRVWILSIVFWLLTIFLDKYIERVSRRMCNLAYVTFVLAQNFQVLAILMLSELIPQTKPSLLEDAFNRNLLGSFLLANILTGIVNLYVDTLSASPPMAFNILLGYVFVLSLFVGFADFMGFRFKFW